MKDAAADIRSKKFARILVLANRIEENGYLELAKALRLDVESYQPQRWHDPFDYWASLLEYFGLVKAEEQAYLRNKGLEPTILI
jgi:hypothetical protein